LAGGTHGELVLVKLAEQYRTALLQLQPGRSIIRRNEVVQDLRSTGGAYAFGQEDVFQRYGDAGKNVHISGSDPLVSIPGTFKSLFVADGDEGINLPVGRLDPCEHRLGRFYRRKLLLLQFFMKFMNSKFKYFHYF